MSIWDDAYSEYQHVNNDSTEPEELEVEISDQPEPTNRYIKIVAYISEDGEINQEREKRMVKLESKLATATQKIKELEKQLKQTAKTLQPRAKNSRSTRTKRPRPTDKKDA